MAWAATWMYVATGTITYLEDAYNYWTMHRNVSTMSPCDLTYHRNGDVRDRRAETCLPKACPE